MVGLYKWNDSLTYALMVELNKLKLKVLTMQDGRPAGQTNTTHYKDLYDAHMDQKSNTCIDGRTELMKTVIHTCALMVGL